VRGRSLIKDVNLLPEGYQNCYSLTRESTGFRQARRLGRVFGWRSWNAAGAGAGAAAGAAAAAPAAEEKPFSMQCHDVRTDRDQVRKLYQVLTEAKKKSGEAVSGNLESFASFVQKKTEEIRKQYGCEAVEYTVEMQNGHVKLKAKAKV